MDSLKLQNLDLSSHLGHMIEENCDIKLEWVTRKLHFNDKRMIHDFLIPSTINKSDPFVLHFIKEFMPVLEQLSLFNDYFTLRSETLLQDSYSLVEGADHLVNDMYIVSSELYVDAIHRVIIIESNEESVFVEKNIDKKKLLYLAANILPTAEIYELIDLKMRQPVLSFGNSEETNSELNATFETIKSAINEYQANPDNQEIPFLLADKLNSFYFDLKAVFDVFRGRQVL